MSTLRRPSFTPDQYLELERSAEYKSEYANGDILALAGATWIHNVIVGNIFAGLHRRLPHGRLCRPFSTDLKVWTPRFRKFVYPDVVVVCGEPLFHDSHRDAVLNPRLIVEVLSSSTEAYDKGEKFAAYQSIGSLVEYVLVPQDSRRIEQYLRRESSTWLYHLAEQGRRSLVFRSLELEVPIEEVIRASRPVTPGRPGRRPSLARDVDLRA